MTAIQSKPRKRFFNQADKDYARSVNILSYLEACGESFEEISNSTYQHSEHGSLRYNARKNVLKWFSRNEEKAAWNCIDAAMMLYQYSFSQAVHDILQKSQYIPENGIQRRLQDKPRDFDYQRDVKETKDAKSAFKYLTEERKLHPNLIQYCIKEGLIAGDSRRNIVFKWRDMNQIRHQGKIVGASLRGTRIIPEEKRKRPEDTFFKGKLSGCEANAGFFMDIGIPKRLVVGEAAIDVLSYISRKMHDGQKNELLHTRFASMEGLSRDTIMRQYAAVHHIQKKCGQDIIPTIKLIVDNDQPGQDFVHDFMNYAECLTVKETERLSDLVSIDEIPRIELSGGKIVKDQNDYLIYQLQTQKEKEKGHHASVEASQVAQRGR
ncbi:DUF3991 domain-containing protein [Listeria goaensis]|uniref:DUF3991 domain-containing protein n=1 Tax=Listeria goaensis TaxID=1649188 RepID=UPI000B58E038|nr:DUF3991 domain-containing protein [Listeria goaensis]